MLGYVKIGDIEGMATQEGHDKWIPIDGLFHGANRNISDGSNDPTKDLKNSRVQIGGIQFTKDVDSSSPKLLEAVCNGTVFDKVTFHMMRNSSGGGAEMFYEYILTNAFIKSYDVNSQSMAGGTVSQNENLSLGFAKIKWSYKVIDDKGNVKGSVDAGWDLLKSRPG